MKLEPIIQSEVSQKERHQYSILTFRKMVTMTLYVRQQKRHWCKEQTFGLCGRRWGWDDLRDSIETSIFSSVQFSRSVVSDSLRCHESQHARPPCPSPTPGVYSNSCSLSWWRHPGIILFRPLLLLPPIPPSIRVYTTQYICVNILYWCFSFWLTSLCIKGSSFIHLIRTDSNAFLLMAE